MSHLILNTSLALSSLWGSKLRSSLTILCVVISIMSIIAVVSILDGMDTYVKEKVLNQGSNVVTLQRINRFEIATDFDKFIESLKNPDLTIEDWQAIKENVPAAEFVDMAINRSANITNGEKEVNGVSIRGRSEEYAAFGEFKLASGRHLTHLDLQQRKNHCVIGWDLAESLYPETDPLGQILKIDNRHFQVIGVCEEKPTVLGGNPNMFAFIPITTFFKQYGSRNRDMTIPIRAVDMEMLEQAKEQARLLMRIRHKLKPAEKDDFHLDTSAELLTFWKIVAGSIFSTLVGIVSITLVVGGIIIMNVMLVSVTERTREVGVRMALGAKRRHIISQFLIEAIILSLIGGILGIILGFTAASLVAVFSPLPYKIAMWSIAAALLITFLVGAISGVLPARKASRLDPVEALRYE